MTDKWVVVGGANCVFCHLACGVLTGEHIEYTYITVDDGQYVDSSLKMFLQACGMTTVPQVFQNGYLIGGYDDVMHYFGRAPSV